MPIFFGDCDAHSKNQRTKADEVRQTKEALLKRPCTRYECKKGWCRRAAVQNIFMWAYVRPQTSVYSQTNPDWFKLT